MILKNCIQIEQGFQNSVNITYDLYNNDKVRSFIPTRSSLEVIEDIMLSTADKSTDRARILIGAYGKGKSHIVLILLSILYNRNPEIVNELLEKIRIQNENLFNFAFEYIKSKKKLLPIVVAGSSTSLTQSFLGALQKALEISGNTDLMPDTHFQAATNMIKKWEREFPETYKNFIKAIDEPIKEFKDKLVNYDVTAYDKFNDIYPSLTSGSEFNPFVGFDVVEIYEKIAEKLAIKGYSGIYVVYDEFSKYLESSITKATVSDTKMLQDFAEKCNRSGGKQMHLLLIAHKDISNYIDKLPKTKVDGWRGVSERFKHVELHNNFSQIYEIISAVIKRDERAFNSFFKEYNAKFDELIATFGKSDIYKDLNASQLNTVVYDCYPLHPLSTFILPRLSEKIAQNERTLFTFLSSENRNTLSAFIKSESGSFPMLTPDLIYDYFEPLFKKEPYTSDTHKIFTMATSILSRLGDDSLEAKIIKSIALIYIVGQFEKLPPIASVIISAYKEQVTNDSVISEALNELQNKQYVIYIKKSNGFLKLKKRYDGDVKKDIEILADKNRTIYDLKQILENSSADNYLYPTRYNDEYEITRYFDFVFISVADFLQVDDFNKKISSTNANGVVYGIIPSSEDDLTEIENKIKRLENIPQQVIFIVPRNFADIIDIAFEFQAVKEIKEEAIKADNDALIEECNIYIEDFEEIITKYIYSYTKPETKMSKYFHNGEQKLIFRKAQFSQLLSDICENIYNKTPIINNEAINKDFLPTVAINSRNKIVSALLATKLEPNFNFTGSGQEISIVRSTLVNSKIIKDFGTMPTIDFSAGNDERLKNVLDIIVEFIKSSATAKGKCFESLYNELTQADHGIGLKKGVIPIYLAVGLHQFKEHCIIKNGNTELLITADLLNSINENPESYTILLENWDNAKTEYISALEKLFSANIIEREKEYNTFSYIVRAMNRWLLSQPKYAKQIKSVYSNGVMIVANKNDIKFVNSLKQSELNAREFLFEKVLEIYGENNISTKLVEHIKGTKEFIDKCKSNLIETLIQDIKLIFNPNASDMVSLTSALKEWYENLKPKTINQVFDGASTYALEVVKDISSDELSFVEKFAKTMTGLRIDDWEDEYVPRFIKEVKSFKKVIDDFNSQKQNDKATESGTYKLTLSTDGESETIKIFSKVEYSKRAKLLKNEIETAISEMGQSITEAEKRQVLLELLKNLC